MTRLGYFAFIFVLLTAACTEVRPSMITPVTPSPAQNVDSPTQEMVGVPALNNSALVDVYDPARDPAEDLRQAILIAQKENKRIMLELGGDWCIWCKYLDEFYETHTAILQFRADHYVLVKVNFSDENVNQEFLSQYPAAAGYPHIYILDSDGTFLHSQATVDLEDGAVSYVPEVFMAFLEKWAPPK